MECELWQDAISAMIDGEDCGHPVHEIELHLSECSACFNFAEFAHHSRRSSIRSAEPVPDLSAVITKKARIVSGFSRWTFTRVVLAVCALEVIVFSVPDLLGSGSQSAHDARHLGSFSIAFGVALLVAAVKPTRARMMMPIALVLAVALMIGAVVDLVNGQIPLVGEARHLPEIVSVGLLWLLAAPPGGRRLPGRRPRGFRPEVVEVQSRSA